MGGRLAGWGGIGNKAQLRPAKAGAGAWQRIISFVYELIYSCRVTFNRPLIYALIKTE